MTIRATLAPPSTTVTACSSTSLRLRGRYLMALGLTGAVACSANEGATTTAPTHDAFDTTSSTGAPGLQPSSALGVPTSLPTTPTTAPPDGTATAAPTSTTLTVVRNGVPSGTFWTPTVSVAVDLNKLPEAPEPGPPSCPHGQFCTTEAHAHGKKMSDAPYKKCATEVRNPDLANSRMVAISFDPDQTKLERAAKSDACCYEWVIPCPGGRPLMIDGSARVAPERTTADWLALSPESLSDLRHQLSYLDEVTRARLSAHYTREASYEHASIASFGRVALSLLATNAPAHLLTEAHGAALDEVRHAEAMYFLASAHARVDIGPAALDLDGARMVETSLVKIAREALIEGCIGEVGAALVLREEALRAEIPAISKMLITMADDEERHAELAFRIVGWALSRDSEVRKMLERELSALRAEASHISAGLEVAPLGLTSARERLELRRRAIADVTLPCIEALLA